MNNPMMNAGFQDMPMMGNNQQMMNMGSMQGGGQMNPMMNPMNPMMNPMNPMMNPIMNPGSIKGTPISSLRKDVPPQNEQHMKYQQQPRQRQYTSDDERDNQNIKNLVRDINKDLDDFVPSRTRDTEDNDTTDGEQEEPIKSKKSYKDYIPNIIKEPILLLAVYLLLSQDFIKRAVANHITYLNPASDGSVSFIGIFIYGVILVVLHTFFKKILL
jgi:hypothetical protein